MKIKRFDDINNKEKVYLKNICQGNYFDDLIGFDPIESKITNYDSEKNSIVLECVMQRVSDGKFFKFFYENWGRGDSNIKDAIAIEVEQKEKTIYYYE